MSARKLRAFRIIGFDAMDEIIMAVEAPAPRRGWYWKKRIAKKYVQSMPYVAYTITEKHY